MKTVGLVMKILKNLIENGVVVLHKAVLVTTGGVYLYCDLSSSEIIERMYEMIEDDWDNVVMEVDIPEDKELALNMYFQNHPVGFWQIGEELYTFRYILGRLVNRQ